MLRRPQLNEILELRHLSLVSVTAENKLPADVEEAELPKLMLSASGRGVILSKEPDVEITVSLKVVGNATPIGPPMLRVEGVYRVLYARTRDHRPSEGELRSFAQNHGVFHVWPYWRELVHSLYDRMDVALPPLPFYQLRDTFVGPEGRRLQMSLSFQHRLGDSPEAILHVIERGIAEVKAAGGIWDPVIEHEDRNGETFVIYRVWIGEGDAA